MNPNHAAVNAVVIITGNDTRVIVGPFPNYNSADLWSDEYNELFSPAWRAALPLPNPIPTTTPTVPPSNWGKLI